MLPVTLNNNTDGAVFVAWYVLGGHLVLPVEALAQNSLEYDFPLGEATLIVGRTKPGVEAHVAFAEISSAFAHTVNILEYADAETWEVITLSADPRTQARGVTRGTDFDVVWESGPSSLKLETQNKEDPASGLATLISGAIALSLSVMAVVLLLSSPEYGQARLALENHGMPYIKTCGHDYSVHGRRPGSVM